MVTIHSNGWDRSIRTRHYLRAFKSCDVAQATCGLCVVIGRFNVCIGEEDAKRHAMWIHCLKESMCIC
jgi:hypothetical protein